MRQIITAALYISSLFSAFAQNIDEELDSKDSNIIVLNDQTIFRIESKDRSLLSRRYEVIIKNKYATDYKNIYLHYDKFRTVVAAEVELTNMDGSVIEKFKIKDFNDYSTGGGVAEDSRVKVLEPSHSKYPFKISVYYEIEKTESLFYPTWYPQSDEKILVKSSEFIVIDNSTDGFRYKVSNFQDPSISSEGNTKTYKWKAQNLEPFKFENYSYTLSDYAPVVYTGPKLFQMDGYEGNMSNWNDYGKWILKLNEGKNDLDPAQLNDLDKLVATAKTKQERTKIIYDYLQSNTRYVSIQLGIGGHQPFSSSFVHEKKYGDCKALSFYTQSLLENYGIKSYYTIIKAGAYASEVDKSFPRDNFNHVILTVPFESDTTFLECTSQTNPYGYLGDFTSDRYAVMVTEDGGKLIRTKKYSPSENRKESKIRVDLFENGQASIQIDRIFSGMEIDSKNFHSLYIKGENEVNKWLLDKSDLGDVKLNTFNLNPVKEGVVPQAGFTSTLESQKEAKIIGKRLFISPEKYFDSDLRKISESNREKPITVKYGYSQYDTLIYKVPENVYIEGTPKTYELDTKFGSYKKEFNLEQGKVMITRKFIFNDGTYPASDFEEFKDFVNSVLKSDRDKLVFLNKT
ncbi:DUF3857 domain-containing protein [Fulvivirga sp.]|uniref:DUF3857 domain-containing protein n=1 Tax=Fulvivirga sp. TaxID=1931237 RepID=UPI0032F07354